MFSSELYGEFNSEILFHVIFFVLGAIFGSFANVVIYRLPKEESIVSPRSRCSSCGTPVKWYDNIPIFSWFLLRGRCRHCQAKFSFRYPLVELLMATLFALVRGCGAAITHEVGAFG